MPERGVWVIESGQVLLPDGRLAPLHVEIRDGRIAALGPGSSAGQRRSDAERLDARGAMVLPGLIELHTHGIRTVSAGSGSLVEYARIEAERGVTTFFPTLFSSPQVSAEQLRRHRRETDELRLSPQVGGFRLEAPYLAMASGGSASALAQIEAETTNLLLEAGGGLIRIWDLSPELPGAPEAIRQLSGQGIVCSLAHTRATRAEGRAAVEAGARLVTHLFDVFFHTPEASDPDPDIYAPGLVDYLLIEDRLVCEIIGDGTHVDPMLVEKAFRCKPPEGLVFVTDSNYGAGLPPGRYTLPGEWGEVEVGSPNDGVRLPDRDMILAGSALTPIDSFRNVIRLFGKDVAAASRVWSTNPARLLGLNKGEIAVGRDADLIVLDRELGLLCTIAAGRVVYRRDAATG
ncbi:MAG: amidohydrolase family protein [Spirochaetales bacterium]|nr:amidohydrolase family protein [Spirochaetales bacterium]